MLNHKLESEENQASEKTEPIMRQTAFYAMLHRMRYIERWGLMRNSERENLKEHTLDVAILAHALAFIRQIYFREEQIAPAPERVLAYALYHDCSEIITGDLPTPIKYFNPDLREQYRVVETYAADYLLSYLPRELAKPYRDYFFPDEDSVEVQLIMRMIKAADRLSAYIKCLEELKLGNLEFKEAAAATLEKLEQDPLPELIWFMEYALPSFTHSIDQLKP